METYDYPIPNNKKVLKKTKKCKSKIVKAATAEVDRTYGINYLNLNETVNELDNDSVYELDN